MQSNIYLAVLLLFQIYLYIDTFQPNFIDMSYSSWQLEGFQSLVSYMSK